MSDPTLRLDSHVWVWTVAGESELGPKALATIRATAGKQAITVSEVSFWELAVKAAKGKLDLGDPADRMLVATAMFYDLQLATADRVVLDYARTERSLRVLDATK